MANMRFFYLFFLLFFVNESPRTCASEIKLGSSLALTGPAAALGINLSHGMQLYFNKVNKEGGVHSKKIKLLIMDDSYEPHQTKKNMHKLINEEKVLAIIGNIGTPTAKVAIPIANKSKTLMFGTLSGAGILRKTPPDRYVINYRASYNEETSFMIEHSLSRKIKTNEISFFTQNDSYGDAGYSGATAALNKIGYIHTSRLTHARYERNTLKVKKGVSKIISQKTKARSIIMVGAYKPIGLFINLISQALEDVTFYNLSFVNSSALAKVVNKDINTMIVTQVVPHFNSHLPIVKEYREELAKSQNKIKANHLSLEGYIVAKIFVFGLRKTKPPLTKEKIVSALESLGKFDIGLHKQLFLSKEEHQASHFVWPTQISKGKVIEFK